ARPAPDGRGAARSPPARTAGAPVRAHRPLRRAASRRGGAAPRGDARPRLPPRLEPPHVAELRQPPRHAAGPRHRARPPGRGGDAVRRLRRALPLGRDARRGGARLARPRRLRGGRRPPPRTGPAVSEAVVLAGVTVAREGETVLRDVSMQLE